MAGIPQSVPPEVFRLSPHRVWVWVAWVTFGLSLLGFYLNLAVFDGRHYMYTSDALYLVTYLDEWFRGLDVRYYYFSAASFLFPDTLILFGLRLLTANIHLQIVAHSALQVTLFTAALYLIARRVFPGNVVFQGLPLLGMSALLLAMRASGGLLGDATAGEAFSPLILNVHHGGMMLTGVWSIWLLIVILQGGTGKRTPLKLGLASLVLFLINGFTIQSDFLYLAGFALPMLAVLIVLYVLRRIRRRPLLLVSTALIGGLAFGILTIRTSAIFSHLSVRRVDPQSWIGFQSKIAEIFAHFPLIPILGGAYLGLGGVALLLALRPSRRDELGITHDTAGLLTLMILTASAAAITLAGVLSWNLETRYYAFALLVVIAVGWPFLLGRFQTLVHFGAKRPVWIGIGALIILLYGANDWTRLSALGAYNDYYPEDVRCLDENTARLGLEGGMAEYWYVKHNRMLSRRGLKFAPVQDDLLPHLWISNPYWYDQRFDFVILKEDGLTHQITAEAVRRRFGEPAGTFTCPDWQRRGTATIWYYNRPTDTPVWDYLPTHPALAAILKGAKRMVFTGDQMLLMWGKRTPEGYLSVDPSDPAGVFMTGPFAYLPVGRYQFEIRYHASATDAGGYAIAPFHHNLIIAGDLPMNSTQVAGTFGLDQALSMEVPIYYQGKGTLTIKEIVIERLPSE
ncbi:MAG: hypothetical protein IAE83_08010 [Anaerolinea sp.]|nr:hypothetical protein [Anaerolinea sp.]